MTLAYMIDNTITILGLQSKMTFFITSFRSYFVYRLENREPICDLFNMHVFLLVARFDIYGKINFHSMSYAYINTQKLFQPMHST